jgi:hypothetical protein
LLIYGVREHTQNSDTPPALKSTILNAPREYEEEQLGFYNSLGEVKSQFTILFVKNKAELNKYSSETIRKIEEDNLLWIVYPKGGSSIKTDLNRGVIWEMMKPSGLRPVVMVAIDRDWSAMRLRPGGESSGLVTLVQIQLKTKSLARTTDFIVLLVLMTARAKTKFNFPILSNRFSY